MPNVDVGTSSNNINITLQNTRDVSQIQKSEAGTNLSDSHGF